MFLKNLIVVCFVFFVIQKGYASEVQVNTTIPTEISDKLKGLDYELDAYKNVVIKIKTPSARLIKKLSAIITAMKNYYKNYGLYIDIPVSQGNFSSKLEALGFKLCEVSAETKTLAYLYANGRNIPELGYAYTAAAVCLLRNNPETGTKEILIINEPQKNIANIIGGVSEKGETPEDAVVRETIEEVGISINKEKLKLVAVCHTVRADKKSYVEFLYVCDEFKGEPKIDGKEVIGYAWVPFSEISKDGIMVFGKPFYPLWQKLLKGDLRDQEYGEFLNATKKGYQYFSPVLD